MPVSRKPSEVDPARLRPLATLPLFFDLRGKPALVAGTGAPAAWKAELLAAAGARVTVIGPRRSEELLALLQRGASDGHIEFSRRHWRAEDLDGCALAVCDAADDAEAAAFAGAARSHGVPCNVIDDARFGDFAFGSIVNRSPVVIGISTAGAAPVLGQAIRRRIEALLPWSLSEWAAAARAMRSRVAETLKLAARRRAFWARFAERAFREAARCDPATLERDLLACQAASAGDAGRVTLVGAGPGDAELLTLKAVRALQSADVILFDDLVSDDVLELARREARRMLVGKRGRRASCRQDDINTLMVKLARQGKHVVRLKSGDPMIFGRAGEEIASLGAAGIAVEVVPGVTAALAMASALGVSLTHRDRAQSVRFLTGHAKSGDLPAGMDWRGLSDPETTLIVYMGGRTASLLARRLIDNGLPADTPTILIEGVSRPGQRHRRLSLAELEAQPPAMVDQPILIGIGAVFAAVRRHEASASASPRFQPRPKVAKQAGTQSSSVRLGVETIEFVMTSDGG